MNKQIADTTRYLLDSTRNLNALLKETPEVFEDGTHYPADYIAIQRTILNGTYRRLAREWKAALG